MSGLYVLGIVVVWVLLTSLLWKVWRSFRAEGRNPDVLFVVLALAWLAGSFWYGGGRKFYYDAEVNRLCAIDGGIKVYETVKLPADKFDKYGVVRIPSKNDAKPADQYYYDRDTTYFKTGNPEIWRSHHQIIRASDGKVLGESVQYARRGGDIHGPWHKSSFGCPDIGTQPSLENSIFVKGDRK